MTDTLTREQIEALLAYSSGDDGITTEQWIAIYKMLDLQKDIRPDVIRALCDLALIGREVQPRPLSQILGRAIVVYDHPDFEGQQAKIVARYIDDAWRDSAIGREYTETTLAIPLSALPKATP